MDKPRRGNLELGVGDGEVVGTVGRGFEEGQRTGRGEVKEKERSEGESRERDKQRGDLWKRQRGKPGEDYQPGSWTPGPVGR